MKLYKNLEVCWKNYWQHGKLFDIKTNDFQYCNDWTPTIDSADYMSFSLFVCDCWVKHYIIPIGLGSLSYDIEQSYKARIQSHLNGKKVTVVDLGW